MCRRISDRRRAASFGHAEIMACCCWYKTSASEKALRSHNWRRERTMRNLYPQSSRAEIPISSTRPGRLHPRDPRARFLFQTRNKARTEEPQVCRQRSLCLLNLSGIGCKNGNLTLLTGKQLTIRSSAGSVLVLKNRSMDRARAQDVPNSV